MPISSEFTAIVTNLEDGTRVGKVPWVPGGADEVFIAAYDQYSLSIARVRMPRRADSPARITYRIRAIDNDGEEIDSFMAQPQDAPAVSQLRALWAAARRKAHNIDEQLTEIAEKIRVANAGE